ncbi:inner membrane-spanning protein YciB [Roseicitreum antarcticum]|uniref:Inner membrane-spanning protein YciB n=1 Tax=Roseicitreum antarcticum TaxID=564137 RepID=A0A1H3C7N3_9RHOB|nr:inner membrane-spanning protein YciB [Roseicitreum antarcticum]SDX50143.1 intracellular septation protein [Roseicitreum antarcticum]
MADKHPQPRKVPVAKVVGKPVPAGLKLGLELGPVLAFFVAYIWLRDRTFMIGGTEYEAFILITAAFVPVMVICSGILWKLSGHLSRMQVVTLVLVVVFGGLTVWLNDDRFFKMKPTIIYALFAGVLGVGLLRGQSWLQYVMDGMMPLQHAGWMLLTKRLAMFFAVLAVANEVIWRTMSTDAWVNFKTFVLPLALFGFFILQSKLFERYSSAPKDET